MRTVTTEAPHGDTWPASAGRSYNSWHVPGLPRFVGHVSLPLLMDLVADRRNYDLIHVHLNRGLIALPAAWMSLSKRRALFVQTHGMVEPWKGGRRILDDLLVRPLVNRADRVFVLTEAEGRNLRSRGSKCTAVLPNALTYEASQHRPRTWRGSEPAQLLFCGRLHPRKGLETFVRVCAQLSSSGTRVEGVVVGPDEGAEEAAMTLARELGAPVRFLGELKESAVREQMQASAVLLHPARAEPFGMVMLEAFAQRLPVVAAHDSALAPCFAEARAALLCADDLDEWCATTNALVRDAQLTDELTENAARLLAERFSVKALSERLYLETLAAGVG